MLVGRHVILPPPKKEVVWWKFVNYLPKCCNFSFISKKKSTIKTTKDGMKKRQRWWRFWRMPRPCPEVSASMTALRNLQVRWDPGWPEPNGRTQKFCGCCFLRRERCTSELFKVLLLRKQYFFWHVKQANKKTLVQIDCKNFNALLSVKILWKVFIPGADK